MTRQHNAPDIAGAEAGSQAREPNRFLVVVPPSVCAPTDNAAHERRDPIGAT